MYDLIIVGAGSGGYEGALYAHRRGMKVALVELSPETVGGNCLNRGLHTIQVYEAWCIYAGEISKASRLWCISQGL